jgi:hypothetical protein
VKVKLQVWRLIEREIYMETGAFFGYKCPKCNTKADIIAVAGAKEPICSCGTKMVPDSEGKSSTIPLPIVKTEN